MYTLIQKTKATVDKLLSKHNRSYDSLFLLLVIILAIYGSVMVFSAGYAYAAFRYDDGLYFVKRQSIWLRCFHLAKRI